MRIDNVAGLVDVLFTTAAISLLLLTRRGQENREGAIPIKETKLKNKTMESACLCELIQSQ